MGRGARETRTGPSTPRRICVIPVSPLCSSRQLPPFPRPPTHNRQRALERRRERRAKHTMPDRSKLQKRGGTMPASTKPIKTFYHGACISQVGVRPQRPRVLAASPPEPLLIRKPPAWKPAWRPARTQVLSLALTSSFSTRP